MEHVFTVDEVLADTAIGCGMHRWGLESGSGTFSTDELRPALEEAYDPGMPNWVQLITWDDETESFHVA